jgi:ribosomal protein S18 acetylase RimI-like enzyme
VIRAAFGEYRGVLDPPSGALAVDARAVRSLMELGGILACESEGRIVACVVHRTHPDHVYLGRLAVLPAFRRQGLGAPLVRFAVASAGNLGGRVMVAHVQMPNVAFFERLGWRPEGQPVEYVGRAHQLMAIDLAPSR